LPIVPTLQKARCTQYKAIEEGLVIGGGLSLLQSKSALSKLSFKRPGEVAGVNVIAEALEEPIRQLVLNNRLNPTDVTKRIKRAKNPRTGFNSETGKLQDLSSVGILDPVATVTYAVQLAFSHTRILLETEAWNSTVPTPKQLDDTHVELDISENPATRGS
jgi:chaperonin GroEL